MTPTQREAAKRLAKELASVHPLHPYVQMCGSAAALLRELLEATDAENATVAPQQRRPLTFTQLCELMPPDFKWGDPCKPALVKHILEAAHGITGEPA